MKKLFATLICFCLVSFNLPVFAAQKMVISTVNKIPIQNKRLAEAYSAYEIIYKDSSEEPMQINTINSTNLVTDKMKAEVINYQSKTYKTLLILGFFTLGITDIISIPVMYSDLDKIKQGASEASTYSENQLVNLRNAVIMPHGEIRLRMMTPINEQPKVNVVFQNMVTKEFVSVESGQ